MAKCKKGETSIEAVLRKFRKAEKLKLKGAGATLWLVDLANIERFCIPIKPLTVNRAWQGRRYKTKEYKKFCQDVGLLIPPGTKHFTGYVEMVYRWHLKNWQRWDFDNPIKPITDVLVSIGIIEDDRKIMRAYIEKIPSDENKIEIAIKPIC